MNKSFKKIAAFTLSLSFIAANAGNFLSNSSALTAKAAPVTTPEIQADGQALNNGYEPAGIQTRDDDDDPVYTPEVQGMDDSYYDAETRTLHLRGYVRNGYNGSGIILPRGIKKDEVYNIVAEKGTVFPQNCSHLFAGFN